MAENTEVVVAEVTAVTRDTVRLSDGRELPSEVTVWTAGFGVPDQAAVQLGPHAADTAWAKERRRRQLLQAKPGEALATAERAA